MATKKSKPKMLSFNQVFSKNNSMVDRPNFLLHHRISDYNPAEVFGGDYWYSLSDEENYENYKVWYIKKFSKLGKALE